MRLKSLKAFHSHLCPLGRAGLEGGGRGGGAGGAFFSFCSPCSRVPHSPCEWASVKDVGHSPVCGSLIFCHIKYDFPLAAVSTVATLGRSRPRSISM